ncbi:MAG: ABC transporter permease, partial [Actinomycetes bacterium]
VGLMGFSMHAPTVQDMPVAVVGQSIEEAEQTAAGLQESLGDVVDLQAFESVESADEAITDQDVVAVYVLPGVDGESAALHTASGAGMAQQRAVSTIFTQITDAQGVTLDQQDIAALTDDDLQGSNSMYFAMAWIMAGFLICAVLRGGAPHIRSLQQLLPLLLGWAVGMSVWLWFLFSVLIGAVHGNAWALIGFGAATILAVSLATSLVTRTIGMAGLPVVIIVMMLAGVPASGGGMSLYMVPEFFRSLHDVLPLAAATDAVRSLTYLGGAGVLQDLFVIVCWAAAALVLSVFVDKYMATREPHPQPERFGAEPAALEPDPALEDAAAGPETERELVGASA